MTKSDAFPDGTGPELCQHFCSECAMTWFSKNLISDCATHWCQLLSTQRGTPAAIRVGRIFTAWNEHNGMEVTIRKHSRSSNLSEVVDTFTIRNSEIGAWRDEVIKVNYGTPRLPHKSVYLKSLFCAPRRADYLTPRIHEMGDTAPGRDCFAVLRARARILPRGLLSSTGNRATCEAAAAHQ
jgi:hypothetical protein